MASIPEGRVTRLERQAKALAAQAAVDALAQSVSAMAPMSAVARVEGEMTAMAAASSISKSYPVDGTTDAAGTIAVLVDPPLLDCTVVPEGPQVVGRAMTWSPVRTASVDGRTSKIVFAFFEIAVDTAKITISVNVGTVPAAAKPAGAGVKVRFRVSGRLPTP